MQAKRVYEVGAYLVATCVVVGVVLVGRLDAAAAASLAKYFVAAWIVVWCRVLYVSLPLATLVFWTLSVGPAFLADCAQEGDGPVLAQATSWPVHFSLIAGALYSSVCYAAASVFHAVWSRQDDAGRWRAVIALVSAAQLLLAAIGVLVVSAEPCTWAFKGMCGLLFVSLGAGSLQGFMLGRAPSLKTTFGYFNWFEAVLWLVYIFSVERFAVMARVGAVRWRGNGDLLGVLGILALALCVANGILMILIPTGEADKKTAGG